jgi:hypothetical protein
MKIFTIVFIVLAIALAAYNFTLVDFSHPFEGDSIVALIGILAAFCSILLLVILNISKKVEQKVKDRTNV